MSEAAILARIERLEAESAIRHLVAHYFRICDRLGPDTEFETLGDLFTADARWEGKGRYAEAFGSHDGRAAIVAMIRSYCLPQPHFAMTAHFFSAEDITVSGETATGNWMMLQTSTYREGHADLRSASLSMSFAREGERWRIRHFRTENIFSRRVDRWSDTQAIPVPNGHHPEPIDETNRL